MARLRSAVAKSLAYDWSDRLLLIEAIWWLGVSRLLLLVVPFRWIAPHLGKQVAEGEQKEEPSSIPRSRHIGWAVRAVAAYTPWQSACLVQALAAKRMLQRRRIPSTLYLGVAKDKDASMQAHAWVRCNGAILTGEAGHQRFTVIASFGDG